LKGCQKIRNISGNLISYFCSIHLSGKSHQCPLLLLQNDLSDKIPSQTDRFRRSFRQIGGDEGDNTTDYPCRAVFVKQTGQFWLTSGFAHHKTVDSKTPRLQDIVQHKTAYLLKILFQICAPGFRDGETAYQRGCCLLNGSGKQLFLAAKLLMNGAFSVSTHIRNASLQDAIRFVMERLPSSGKPRAFIRTATHSIYYAEIEALYRQPELRGKLHTVFDSAGRTYP
jgi:hypothetical protein